MDVATATVTESDSGLIDQAIAEYEALRVGGRHSLLADRPAVDGKLEVCGSPDEAECGTISYVPDGEGAVLPLAVGPHAACFERLAAMYRSGLPFWDARIYPPPAAIVDGARRPFRPMRGRLVVGAVEARGCSVLLVAVGESLAVVHVAGKAKTILYRGRPLGFSELDVDSMPCGHRSHGRRSAPRVRPSARVRADHLRIVGAVEVDVGDGPSIDVVLGRGLGALEWRARTVKLTGRRKRRGKTKLRRVMGAFRRVILAGGAIFDGRPGEILEELGAHDPDLDIDVETFADILRLLYAAGTCLVQRPTPRRWRLCLSPDLRDPTSDLHRRFCEETVALVREMVLGDGLTAANEEPANEPSRATRSRSKRSARTPNPEATASPGSSGDPTTSSDPDPQAAERSAPTTPAPSAAASGAPTPEPASSHASSGDSTTSRSPDRQPPSASPAEAEPSAATEPAVTAASTQATGPNEQGESERAAGATDGGLDARYAYLAPTMASLWSWVQLIESWIDDDPDPLARARREAAIEGALLKFASSLAERGSGRGTGPRVDGCVALDPAEHRESRVDDGPAGGVTETPATEPLVGPRAAGEQAAVRADVLVAPEVDAAAGQSEADAASVGPSSDELSGGELDELVETAGSARDHGEAGINEETASVVERVEASEGPSAAGNPSVLPVSNAPPLAPREGGAAEISVGHRLVGAERPRADHEDDTLKRAELAVDAGPPDVRSNTALPIGAAARCDARASGPRTRRRSLFVPANCAVMHTEGWAAPLVAAELVQLARFSVPAPWCEPQCLTDDIATVSVMLEPPELLHVPRGPPRG